MYIWNNQCFNCGEGPVLAEVNIEKIEKKGCVIIPSGSIVLHCQECETGWKLDREGSPSDKNAGFFALDIGLREATLSDFVDCSVCMDEFYEE